MFSKHDVVRKYLSNDQVKDIVNYMDNEMNVGDDL